MRVEKLQLKNVRGFASLDLAFDPSLTVLVGGSGAGKSTLLSAPATLLNEPLLVLMAGLNGAPDLGSFRWTDFHNNEAALSMESWQTSTAAPGAKRKAPAAFGLQAQVVVIGGMI